MTAKPENRVYIVGSPKPECKTFPKADAKMITEAIKQISKLRKR